MLVSDLCSDVNHKNAPFGAFLCALFYKKITPQFCGAFCRDYFRLVVPGQVYLKSQIRYRQVRISRLRYFRHRSAILQGGK